MNLREFKNLIEKRIPYHDFLIFKEPEDATWFLINSYLKALKEINNQEIYHIDNLDKNTLGGMFRDENQLRVFICDNFDYEDNALKNIKDLVVITSKISIKTESIFSDCIINFPVLEEWQIKEWINKELEGVSQEYVDLLYKKYSKNIDRLNNEVTKISIFDTHARQYICRNLKISDNKDVFRLINCILKKDKAEYNNIVSLMDLDFEPLSFISLFSNSLKNIIKIQLDKKSTPESTGMSQKQFNAIKYYNSNIYSDNDLIDIFNMITSLDYKIKSGEIPSNKVINYVINYCFSKE